MKTGSNSHCFSYPIGEIAICLRLVGNLSSSFSDIPDHKLLNIKLFSKPLTFPYRNEAQKEATSPKVSQIFESKTKMSFLPYTNLFFFPVLRNSQLPLRDPESHFPWGNVDCPSWSPNLLLIYREIEGQRMERITQSGQAWPEHTARAQLMAAESESSVGIDTHLC